MIKLEGVTKQYLYGGRVLGALDITVNDGEIVAVLGGVGSGKTSLLKTIAGVTDCEGEALVDGKPVGKRADNVQFVFDDLAVFKRRTFFYNLTYPLKIRGFDKEYILKQANAAAKRLDVMACLPERVKNLPLIDVKRLAMARLLLRDAQNILIDDITTGLSASDERELWAQIVPILLEKAKRGSAVIFSTQSAEEALSIADRIAVMSAGELKQFDSPQNIYERPASVWAAQALDRRYHFESVYLEDSDGRLTIVAEDGLKTDVTSLKDRVLPQYIGKRVLAGWHGTDFASDGEKTETVEYVVRENDKYVHYTSSGLQVVLPQKQSAVCVCPMPDRVTLFDINNENSILK